MHGYLNWWMGGLALGGITVLFRVLTGRALGVSGSWRRVVFWRQERELDKTAEAIKQDQDGAANAMMAAAMEEFGEDALAGVSSPDMDKPGQSSAKQAIPWTAHLVFLICLALGGTLWAWYSGDLHFTYELSAIHHRISGSFGGMVFTLVVGGFLVGMGTQMAGGCSSGHGLSGCSNFAWSSLVATAIFFSTAVVAAFLIKAVM